MACSACHSDFDENSFEILNSEENFLVLKLKCSKCFKDFGVVIVNLTSGSDDILPFSIESTPKLISKDEVIDAHIFLKNLKHDWKKHIPTDFIQK